MCDVFASVDMSVHLYIYGHHPYAAIYPLYLSMLSIYALYLSMFSIYRSPAWQDELNNLKDVIDNMVAKDAQRQDRDDEFKA